MSNLPNQGKKKKVIGYEFDQQKMYFEGQITDSLPGTRFIVKVERNKPNGSNSETKLEPLMIECTLRTVYKHKHIRVIRGDSAIVEVDPTTGIQEDGTMKGQIVLVERKMYTPPPKKI